MILGDSGGSFAFEDGDGAGLTLQFLTSKGTALRWAYESPLSFTGGEGLQIVEDEDDLLLHPGGVALRERGNPKRTALC